MDVRLVAATNRDLAEAMQDRPSSARTSSTGSTRSRSRCPPLRERREDVASSPSTSWSATPPTAASASSAEALAALEAYDWPGNVRELLHAIERAVILAKGDEIQPADLPAEVQARRRQPVGACAAGSLEDMERQHIVTVLRQVGGHRGKAAALLGIDPKTLYRKIHGYGINPEAMS